LKITIEEPRASAGDEIIVRCHNISPELLNMLNSFKTPETVLIANLGSDIHRVNYTDIFYIETVDKKTFLYCEGEVYESKQKLYELEALGMKNFYRVSKSVILNLRKVKALSPSLSGKVEVILTNGERVIIARPYVSELKKSLGI